MTLEQAIENYNFGFSVTFDGDSKRILFGTNCNCCGRYFESGKLSIYCSQC